jgi:EpsI family protein
LLIGFALCAAAIAGVALKPARTANEGRKIDLESMIPVQFSDWRLDGRTAPLVIDPQSLAVLHRIYSQTLARTYVNGKGLRVMLSIAYGGDESDSMQMHPPKWCYVQNGFQILKLAGGKFDTGFGPIPVKRMLAARGDRVEPIIYWTAIGNTVAVGSLEMKLAQLKYGLKGKVPDGLIFRVSTIGDETSAYPMEEEFIRLLLKSLTPEARRRLIGGVA